MLDCSVARLVNTVRFGTCPELSDRAVIWDTPAVSFGTLPQIMGCRTAALVVKRTLFGTRPRGTDSARV